MEIHDKLAVLKKEAWLNNVMKVMNCTRDIAEAAYNRIYGKNDKHKD